MGGNISGPEGRLVNGCRPAEDLRVIFPDHRMIKFEKISKKFGDITALSGVSFEIERGEFVFLTGPSGSGKTTIIKLILREFLPSEGKFFLEGKEISKIRGKEICDLRRKVGVVFQDFKLLSNRTVFENVMLPLEIRKMEKKKIAKQVEEILKMVNLWERKDLFPAQLAVGEIQRTAIARAMVADPQVLLADEPTGNLDPQTTADLMKILKEINKKGTTVLMATHNAQIVNLFKERVILLKEGKLVSDQKKGKYQLE